MSRKKQKTLINNQPEAQYQTLYKPYSRTFVPEYPLTSKLENMHAPDSLQRFQWELESSLLHQRELRLKSNQMEQRIKRRAITQYNEDSGEIQKLAEIQRKAASKISKLQKEVKDLRQEVTTPKSSGLQDKLDRLLEEMIRNREADRQFYRLQQQRPSQPPNNIFYPPMPMYPQTNPYEPQRTRYDKTNSTFQPKYQKNRNSRRLLRKYFFVVLFTKYLKSQSHQLAKARKQILRKFYLEKFDTQILNLKNWLVEGHGYCFPVILEKQDIDLQFWVQKRQVIEREKQRLILELVQLGLQKLKKDCTPQKISFFSEILYNLCMRGSFVMSRFWSAIQMESICLSEFYGCIRADENLQKFMITMVVFLKVLVFNMFLQPHKFDNINFPKRKKVLTKNMIIIGSVYYRLAKQVLSEYLQRKRPEYYKLGNWLNLKEQFIVECCEPLKFNCDYPQQGEYISGLFGNELQILEMRNQWGTLKDKIEQITGIIHKQLGKRRKQTLKTQKYKLYN